MTGDSTAAIPVVAVALWRAGYARPRLIGRTMAGGVCIAVFALQVAARHGAPPPE